MIRAVIRDSPNHLDLIGAQAGHGVLDTVVVRKLDEEISLVILHHDRALFARLETKVRSISLQRHDIKFIRHVKKVAQMRS